jgi:hypothetical protein
MSQLSLAFMQDYAAALAAADAAKQRLEDLEAVIIGEVPDRHYGEDMQLALFEDGARLMAHRPLVEEWDGEELQAAAADLMAANVDTDAFLKLTYEVDKRALRRQPPEIQERVRKALTLTPHKKNGELRKPRIWID